MLGSEKLKQYTSLQKKLESLKKQTVPADYCLGVTESGPRAPETFVLIRGNHGNKGAKVEPGFPQVLTADTPDLPRSPDRGEDDRPPACFGRLVDFARPIR